MAGFYVLFHTEEGSMSRIKEFRASLDKKLNALEHQALALEAQLTQTKDQAMLRLEQRKQQLRDLLKQVQGDVQKSKEMAEQAKTEVQAKLEHLQVQLALGKADARDTFEEQRTKTLKALNEFEFIAEQKLKGAAFESGRVWEDLVDRTSTLEAEFEALKGRFESEKAKQQVTLESKKQELLTNLVSVKDQLKAKRVAVEAKADVFETDLRQGLDQIKAGFRKLFE
jgi:DNA repair exonuclease SbcCD ATPase subunit